MIFLISFGGQVENDIDDSMAKKNHAIGLRVEDEIYDKIKTLSYDVYDDDRHLATLSRKLIIEALEHRGVLKRVSRKKR